MGWSWFVGVLIGNPLKERGGVFSKRKLVLSHFLVKNVFLANVETLLLYEGSIKRFHFLAKSEILSMGSFFVLSCQLFQNQVTHLCSLLNGHDVVTNKDFTKEAWDYA